MSDETPFLPAMPSPSNRMSYYLCQGINRIYMTDHVAILVRNWAISLLGILGTDHLLASIQMTYVNSPHVRRGRWTLKPHIIKDKLFRNYVIKTSTRALEEIGALKGHHTTVLNPKTIYIYIGWKDNVFTMVRNCDKVIVPRYTAKKLKLESRQNYILEEDNLVSGQI